MMINVKPIAIYQEEMLNIELEDEIITIPTSKIDQFSIIYDKICIYYKNQAVNLYKNVKKAYFSENGVNYTIYEEKGE